MTTWWRHREVLAHLRVDPKTLRTRMRENPPDLDPPWVDVSSGRRPEYRWRADEVDAWWIAVNRALAAPATRTSPRVSSARKAPAPTVSLVEVVRSHLKAA